MDLHNKPRHNFEDDWKCEWTFKKLPSSTVYSTIYKVVVRMDGVTGWEPNQTSGIERSICATTTSEAPERIYGETFYPRTDVQIRNVLLKTHGANTCALSIHVQIMPQNL